MRASQRFSSLIFVAMLLALTSVLMFDDIIFYLLFERLLGWKLSWLAKLGVGAVITLLNLLLALLIIKALKEKPQTGAEGMVGKLGIVVRIALPDFWVKVNGELWHARTNKILNVGEKIVVRRLEGLTLDVERVDSTTAEGGAV